MNLQAEIGRIEHLLDGGELDEALRACDQLVRRFPDNPAALVCRAEVCRFLDLPQESALSAAHALQHLKRTHGTGEDLRLRALFSLAWAEWQQWRFDAAERHLRELLAADDRDASAWDLLAAVLEHQGRAAEAAEAAKRAEELDPESFPVPLELDPQTVDDAIQAALVHLPRKLRKLAREVPIVVQDFPTREMAASPAAGEPPLPPDILGLYVGQSRLERSFLDTLPSPGTIFVFKRNLERYCGDLEALQEELEVTLHHELAHYLGFEERHMGDLGLE